MSKIQKALGVLREDRTQTHDSGISRRRQHRQRYVAENAAEAEVLPDFDFSIDIDSLKKSGLHPNDEDFDYISQEFRRIKRPILNTAFKHKLADGENPNMIMVSSALPKSGKTFCSVNLAMSIARERDVGAVIVDADVLKPNISRILGLDDRIGLIDYLLDPNVSIDEILVATDLYGIIVVPAGRRHDESTELLASRRMQEFVHELAERYVARAIIVDTPPLLLTNEAKVLSEHVGQVVLVIEAGVSSQESVTEAIGLLNSDKPINAILNKSRGIGNASYGYYGSHEMGYGYGQEET